MGAAGAAVVPITKENIESEWLEYIEKQCEENHPVDEYAKAGCKEELNDPIHQETWIAHRQNNTKFSQINKKGGKNKSKRNNKKNNSKKNRKNKNTNKKMKKMKNENETRIQNKSVRRNNNKKQLKHKRKTY